MESDGHVVHGISPFVRASYQTDSFSPDFIRVVHVKVMPAVRGLLVSGDTSLCPEFDNSLGQRAENLCASSTLFPFLENRVGKWARPR